jgi:hypothetical protein
MDRIFQWVWDRYGPRYSWAICVLVYPPGLVVYLSYSLIIVAFQGSDRYIDAAAITAVAVLIRVYVWVLPGSKGVRPFEQWAAGHQIDPMAALTKTTGDAILMTQQTVDALAALPPGLTGRGSHELKGKSAAVAVYALEHVAAPAG